MKTNYPVLTRARLGALVVLATLGLSAQTAPAPVAPAATTPQQLETFEVTGSRIRGLLGEADFNPLISFDATDIEHSGVTTIGELARMIPQVTVSGSFDGLGLGGQAVGTSLAVVADGSTVSANNMRTTINLRGLGGGSTLVLVNGRRLARTGNIRGNDDYDLAGISVSAIERVEVVTDGASAVYGSDAVAGVVNLILKKNYTGTDITYSYENTFNTDTAAQSVDIVTSTRARKFSLSVGGSMQDRHGFAAVDRDFSASDDHRPLGGADRRRSGLGLSQPGGIGAVAVGSGGSGTTLPTLGRATAAIPANSTGKGLTVADFAAAGPAPALFDRAPYTMIITPQRRSSASVRAEYDLHPRVQLFANGNFSRTTTHIGGLPVDLRNPTVPASYIYNPFGVAVQLQKTFLDEPMVSGSKNAITETNTASAGFRGNLPHDWRYEGSLDWGRSRLNNDGALDPVLDTAKFNAALASGVVLFYDDRTQHPNPRGTIASLLTVNADSDRSESLTWSASADGPVRKLWAGPLRVALGGEIRQELIDTFRTTPEASNINLRLLGHFSRRVMSAYTEFRLPLISPEQHWRWLHRVDFTTALRYDTYSDIGGDYSPRFGLTVRPTKWLLLRTTRNYAFKVPTINALYRPVTRSTNANTSGFFDPVSGTTAAGTLTTIIGGNLDLKPEHSRSSNYGVVLEAPFALLKGLSVSLDYIDMSFRDRVGSLNFTEWVTLAPERIVRDATGRITAIDTRSINLSEVAVKSVDYQLRYRRTFGLGTIDSRFGATDYRKWDSIRVAGSVPVTSLQTLPTRLNWQLFWSRGPLGAGVSGFYQAPTRRTYNGAVLYDSAIEWNVQTSYDFGHHARRERMAGAAPRSARTWREQLLADTKLSVTVFNFINREPVHWDGQAGFAVTDPRMRRYALTLRKKL